MSDDVEDGFEDIFDQFRKFFKLDSGIFDMDFYMFPEALKDQKIDLILYMINSLILF